MRCVPTQVTERCAVTGKTHTADLCRGWMGSFIASLQVTCGCVARRCRGPWTRDENEAGRLSGLCHVGCSVRLVPCTSHVIQGRSGLVILWRYLLHTVGYDLTWISFEHVPGSGPGSIVLGGCRWNLLPVELEREVVEMRFPVCVGCGLVEVNVRFRTSIWRLGSWCERGSEEHLSRVPEWSGPWRRQRRCASPARPARQRGSQRVL